MIRPSHPLVYLITDRRSLPAKSGDQRGLLIDLIRRAVDAEVDLVQIRERDLPASTLLSLIDEALAIARSSGTRILVNDRVDVALCAGAGVHLTTRSMIPEVVRQSFGRELLLGLSTHSLPEAVAGERGGADFIVFGPVFETESKAAHGPPTGVDALAAVAKDVEIPVLALGGITEDDMHLAIQAGAAGIAGISMFQQTKDLATIVKKARSLPLKQK